MDSFSLFTPEQIVDFEIILTSMRYSGTIFILIMLQELVKL